MPAARPTFIDVRSRTNHTMATGLVSPRGLPSPRIAHYDGEIPPQMSPLDAFAAQSRLLAKQLDESKRDGRRVSRLPPLMIANSLSNSGYTRSRSVGAGDGTPDKDARSKDGEQSGNTPEVEEPDFRPKSFYPRMSGIRQMDDEKIELLGPSPDDQPFVTPAEFRPPFVQRDYFGSARHRSPEPVASIRNSREIKEQPPWVKPQRSFDSPQLRTDMRRGLSTESTSAPKVQNTNALAPPISPQVRHAASIRSIPVDSSDDELSASTGGSSVSQHRKLSSSSGLSTTHSPLSPLIQGHGRSPSQTSEFSVGGSRLARPTYNFSRPLSRGSRPSMDVRREPSFDNRPSMDARRQQSFNSRPSLDSQSRQPSSDRRPQMDMMRQASADSQPFIFTDDGVHTPMSMDNEQFFDPSDQQDPPAPSYIYAKYSLPRGRMLQRDSRVLENKQAPLFEWAPPGVQSNVVSARQPARARGHTEPSPTGSAKPSMGNQKDPEPLVVEQSRTWPSGPQFPPIDPIRPIRNRPPPNPTMNETPSESSASTRSASTIKPRPRRAVVNSMDLSAEDHLAKGIESHERGDVKESTYHFRLAAKQNLPTAMLLYALACRHGWGMRPNPQEAVQWLRKAADSASLEIADEKDSDATDLLEQKTKRAQFALSIYELGVSHMNGWGIEQDKSLALRCFEIAGNWGDADAMAEAGFCYAQAQGCKKDLKKAARYYRMAEAKGMSMVGNSW